MSKVLEEENFELASYSEIIIIPGVGCGGCIQKAQLDFQNNNNPKTLYVFTNIVDLKIFKHEISYNTIEKDNVYLDLNDKFSEIGLISIYPQKIFWKNGDLYSKVLSNSIINN